MSMRRRLWLAASAGLIVPQFLKSARAQDAEPVARIDKLQGTAGIGRGTQKLGCSVAAPVFEDDVLTTGANSRVSMTFIDQSTLTLGADAEMVVDEFVFNRAGQKNAAVLKWAAGAFLTATGAIGKANPEAVSVRTPTVTIGIRGTQFWGGILDRDFDVLVLEGRVIVTNAAGSVELGVGETTSVASATAAPLPASVMADDRRTRAFATVTYQN